MLNNTPRKSRTKQQPLPDEKYHFKKTFKHDWERFGDLHLTKLRQMTRRVEQTPITPFYHKSITGNYKIGMFLITQDDKSSLTYKIFYLAV